MQNESDQIAPDSPDADSFICKRCSKINLDEIFSLKRISWMGHHILDFRSASEIVEDPNCSFCQAFDFISPPSLVKPVQHLSCSLVAVHSEDPHNGVFSCCTSAGRKVLPKHSVFLTTKVEDLRRREKGSNVWRMGNTGQFDHAICGLRDFEFPGCLGLPPALKKEGDLFMASSVGSTVDFNVVRSWIKTCEEKHGDYCAPTSTQNSTRRLIECSSRRVVATPKPPEISTYAALSYVWGNQEAGEVCSEELPKQLPKTIEDAITVTKNLGIPYLWIDRYCINQDDEGEKHNQCSLMNRIYENAHVTIIAAAGSGPHHGLPGIGSPRRSFPSVRIGSHLLEPTLPDPRLSIRAAKWSTRGWTYQENRLSKRRLVFTDRQVLFVCRRACTDEGEQKLQPDTELPNGDVRSGGSLSPFCMPEESFHEIWDEISQFSKLDLTRPEDCLNAMLGILQRYQQSDRKDGPPLRHLAGLPVVKKEMVFYKTSERHEPSTWAEAIFESLAWTTSKATERRDVSHPGFPSWSWTSWKTANYRIVDISARPNRFDPPHWTKSVFVEQPHGSIVEGKELDSLLEACHDFSRIRYIHLTAPSLNFTLFTTMPWNISLISSHVRDAQEQACVVRLRDVDLFCHFELTNLSVHIPENGLHCWGIMLVENNTKNIRGPLFLVVMKVKDWYERIGIAEVHGTEALYKLFEARTFRLG